jgi:RNA polymerase sigma-70 factor (ECF subfamily)
MISCSLDAGSAAVSGRACRSGIPLDCDIEGLVAACAAGDPQAWRRLLEAVRQLAIHVARRQYHLGVEDAEDLAQLVQIRVSARLPQLRRPGAFPLWVRRIIHHVAIDLLRQRRSPLSLDDSWEAVGMLAVDAESAELYDRALVRADLERALARLPPRYREPIRLHLVDGVPQGLIARLLGRPRSTVATQIERGLARLRRSLAGMMVLVC